jgi:hypothetical protein
MTKFIVSGILQSVCKGTAGDLSNFGSLQLESLAVTLCSTILHGAHIAFICSIWMSEQTATLIYNIVFANVYYICVSEVMVKFYRLEMIETAECFRYFHFLNDDSTEKKVRNQTKNSQNAKGFDLTE